MAEATTTIQRLHAFDDNFIWVLRDHGITAVVDPGDAGPVFEWLAQSGDRLGAILLTHHHGDHVGGVAALVQRYPVPVFGPALENIAGVTHPLQHSDRITVPGIDLALQVIGVPGHTRGHIAYYNPTLGGPGAVFCGDTLFGAGCGRLFEGTPAQMLDSLSRLAVLPAPTLVFCAHEYTLANLRFALAVEPDNAAVQQRQTDTATLRAEGRASIPSTIGVELATNPFMRWEAAAVKSAAATRLGHPPEDAVATFAAIREWKNRF